jgi:hypothetical protein
MTYNFATLPLAILISFAAVAANAQPIVRDHRSPAPIVRDHRTVPIVRDHRSPAPVVRDHRTTSEVRDHRGPRGSSQGGVTVTSSDRNRGSTKCVRSILGGPCVALNWQLPR